MSFTFHRAFDVVSKPKESLLQLLNLGVDRLLTSGQQEKAEDSIDLLLELQKLAKNKLTILPGSGINSENCIHFKNNGFSEIHSSASKIISSRTHPYFGNTPQTVSDIDRIKSILDTIA
jgi:copper homeostasis protein